MFNILIYIIIITILIQIIISYAKTNILKENNEIRKILILSILKNF